LSGDSIFQVSLAKRLAIFSLILLGAITAIVGLLSAPSRVWPNLLLNSFYLVSLALSGMLFLTTQRLAGSRWSSSLRRVAEGFMLVIPVASLLMLSVWFGRQTLYAWGHPGGLEHEPAIAGKAQYLQPTWILVRTIAACLLWNAFALLLRKRSIEQDQNPKSSLALHRRLTRYSACFVPIFAVTFTLASFDWIISLEPRWFSTMFAIYAFAGMFVQGIAAITLAALLLKDAGYLRDSITENRLHDLGKMLFAFSTFWAYIWVCQYLLIWYGNIPEEATYFIKRTSSPWVLVFALNFLVSWIIPFAALLSARTKQRAGILKAVSLLLLCGHWIDLYVMIMPAQWPRPQFGLFEILITAGYAALAYLVVLGGLRRAPIVPVHDPILAFEFAVRPIAGPVSGIADFGE
jgi:hypothetical protein